MTEYCDKHIQLCEDIATIKQVVLNLDRRINGSIDHIQSHVKSGSSWRMAIASVALSLILTIIGAVFGYGKLCQQVNYLEKTVVKSNGYQQDR